MCSVLPSGETHTTAFAFLVTLQVCSPRCAVPSIQNVCCETTVCIYLFPPALRPQKPSNSLVRTVVPGGDRKNNSKFHICFCDRHDPGSCCARMVDLEELVKCTEWYVIFHCVYILAHSTDLGTQATNITCAACLRFSRFHNYISSFCY